MISIRNVRKQDSRNRMPQGPNKVAGRHNIRSLLAATTVLCCLASSFANAQAPAASTDNSQANFERILHNKKIIVGWTSEPPTEMKDPISGKVTGFYIDAVRYIFQKLGVQVQFVETPFSQLATALQSGEIDMSVASTFITVQRAAVIDFTQPILYLGYSAVVRANEKRFSTLADFNKPGVKIAVLLGGSSQDYVRDNFPKAQIVALNSTNQAAPFIEVASGRADIGINDAYSVHRFVKTQPGLKDLFGTSPYNLQPMAWTVRRGNYALLNFLNASLSTLQASGRLEKMASAYEVSGRFKLVQKFEPVPGK